MREQHHARHSLSGRKLLLSIFIVTLGVLFVSLIGIAFSAARSTTGLRGTDRAGKQRTGYVTEHQHQSKPATAAAVAGASNDSRCAWPRATATVLSSCLSGCIQAPAKV